MSAQTGELADANQLFSNFSPEQKYRTAMGLLYTAIRMKEASLKSWYPELSENERKKILVDFVLYART